MIYKLVSEDLSGVGGPMWAQATVLNWEKYYATVDGAKKGAERDYKNPIKWSKDGKSWVSPDFGYVMYTITPIKIEK